MPARFLELKNNKASNKVSVGFIFAAIFSSIVVNLLLDATSIFYYVVQPLAWFLCWIITNGDAVNSRRKTLYSYTHPVLTPNFEDTKCLYHELENLSELKGILIQTKKENIKNNDWSEWEED